MNKQTFLIIVCLRWPSRHVECGQCVRPCGTTARLPDGNVLRCREHVVHGGGGLVRELCSGQPRLTSTCGV